MLALLCTAFTYIIFYRLMMAVGPAKASTVTFLIPIFGVLWGWLWLEEQVTQQILMGAGIIIVGTALATGIVTENVWRRQFKR
jgi:drug/metabolite transporter (DMT)-like permease